MKIFLLTLLLGSLPALACNVKIEIHKNQTNYEVKDFPNFIKALKKRSFIIRDSDLHYTIGLRLKKRMDHYHGEKYVAKVSVDLLNPAAELIVHAAREGKISLNPDIAYSAETFDAALVEVAREFPSCNR